MNSLSISSVSTSYERFKGRNALKRNVRKSQRSGQVETSKGLLNSCDLKWDLKRKKLHKWGGQF